MSGEKYYKGRFIPKNPKKYVGRNSKNIIHRSFWELKFMRYLDNNPNILEWSSECVIIPYVSPIDKKIHSYYPDFYVKKQKRDGTIIKEIIEIKPNRQTKRPEKKNKSKKTYLTEHATFLVNSAKWRYAKEFCNKHNMEFTIITEIELGIKK